MPAMAWPISRTAAVSSAGVMTGPCGVAYGATAPEVATIADVVEGSSYVVEGRGCVAGSGGCGGAPVPVDGGSGGGMVEAGGGPDIVPSISDTKLIGLRILPAMVRRL